MAKIVYLVLHLGIGGVEKAIANQANILCEHHDVEIISAYRLYDTPPFKIDSRVKITYLLTDLKPNKEQLLAAFQQKKLLDLLRQGWISSKVLWLRTAKMKQAVRALRADVIISSRYLYNRVLVKNRPQGSIIIAQEHRHHNQDQKYIRKLIRSVKGMDYFMPVSSSLTRFYANLLEHTSVRCIFIPHNLDIWPEKPADKGNHRFVSVGRLSREKGYSDLIDIFAHIAQEIPDSTLDIIGGGEEECALTAQIHACGLEQRVILHGYQDKDYVNKILSRCSVYLMASHEESFGIVLIEAQSFGLPCVAFSSAEGAKEIITDSVNGYLIDSRDKDAFARRALELITDPQLNKQFGAAARANASRYTRTAISRQWFDFFDHILS